MHQGHYIAYVKTSNGWFEMDDAKVNVHKSTEVFCIYRLIKLI